MAKIPRREESPPYQRINARREEEKKTMRQQLINRKIKEIPQDIALKTWVGKIEVT